MGKVKKLTVLNTKEFWLDRKQGEGGKGLQDFVRVFFLFFSPRIAKVILTPALQAP